MKGSHVLPVRMAVLSALLAYILTWGIGLWARVDPVTILFRSTIGAAILGVIGYFIGRLFHLYVRNPDGRSEDGKR